MDRQSIAMALMAVCAVAVICLVVFGVFEYVRAKIAMWRCQHVTTRRCYGDERIYYNRRCLGCGKGFA